MNTRQRLGKRLNRSTAGMTLIELTIAVGILAMTLGVLFSTIINLYDMGMVAEGRTRAATIMTSVMEEVRGRDFVDLLTWNPNPIGFEDADRVAVVLEAINNNGEEVELPSNGTAADFPNPMEVRATVLWTVPRGRAFSITASTFVGR